MVSEKEILSALWELYRRVGTQLQLAGLAGITQSTINAYLSGKAKIKNMPIGVFLRLFQDMKIDFFGDSIGKPEDTIRKELLYLFDQQDLVGKTKLLAMAAANFGEELREKTKK